MSVESPWLALLAAIAGAVLLGLAARSRRWDIGIPLAIGTTLLMLAASGLQIARPVPGKVIALVDVSPSTRGARFRNITVLKERLRELCGRDDVEIVRFAGSTLAGTDEPLAEVATDWTSVGAPGDADAVLLFSDGRLTYTPSRAVVFSIVDAALDDVADGRIGSIERIGERALVDVHSYEARTLSANGSVVRSIGRGDSRVELRASPDSAVTITLNPGDRWPENDAMTIDPPLERATQKWWVGSGPPPDGGWRDMTSLPAAPEAWLAAAVLVLQDVPLERLDDAQQRAIARYVRDLGGAVVIVGGERSLSAGAYGGSVLDALSPLASAPPEPARRWVVLVDASGSMSAKVGAERTRLDVALEAAVACTRALPPADRVDVACFARELRWVVRDVAPATVEAPRDVLASGPTNLRAALDSVLASISLATVPVEILLLSDADADVGDTVALRTALAARNVRLHVLALSPLKSDAPLRRVAASVVEPDGIAEWERDAVGMARAHARVEMERGTLLVEPWGLSLLRWNRTWLRAGAETIGRAKPLAAGEVVVGARWNVGLGRVATLAFEAPASVIASVVEGIRARPVDSRFAISWSAGEVVVDAMESSGVPMNGLQLTLDVDGAKPVLSQRAPGHYGASFTRSEHPRVGRLFNENQLLDAASIPRRHAYEFDVVGNDRAALAEIAGSTGGEMIEPHRRESLALPLRVWRFDLTWALAVIGMVAMTIGLIRWRRG